MKKYFACRLIAPVILFLPFVLYTISCNKPGLMRPPVSTETNSAGSRIVQLIETAPLQVTTAAGNGSAARVDGPALSAQFYFPMGLACDSFGTIVVADSYNHCIRQIAPNQNVTTKAGYPTGPLFGSFQDGLNSLARFNSPTGVTVSHSYVYVADFLNNRIRVIMPAYSFVNTVAGTGEAGFADGLLAQAKFDHPLGIIADPNGSLFVTDSYNNRIRKIFGQTVTTLAGSGIGFSSGGFADGPADVAKFNYPTGITVDRSGNVFVADTYNQRIRKITPDGVVSTLAGNGTIGMQDGQGSAAQFYNPSGLAIDHNGNLFVADMSNHRIRKITPDGTVTTIAGTGNSGILGGGYLDGLADSARFKCPMGIVVTPSNEIYVSDTYNNRIRKIQ